MCEVVSTCPVKANYWVQTKREIPLPDSEFTSSDQRSGRNIMSCSRHVAMAIRNLGKINRDACTMVDGKDGVTVKLRTEVTVSGRTWDAWL